MPGARARAAARLPPDETSGALRAHRARSKTMGRPARFLSPRRARWLMFFIVVFHCLLLVRVTYIQSYKRQFHLDNAPTPPGETRRLAGDRGRVLDRGYRVLAESVPAITVAASPRVIQRWALRESGAGSREPSPSELRENESIQLAARTISATLGLPYDEILDKLSWNRRYVVLARAADADRAEQLRQLRISDVSEGAADGAVRRPYAIPGLYFERTHRREYPFDNLASAVIGYCNAEQVPMAGVERSFRQIMEGGQVAVGERYDGSGRRILRRRMGRRVQPPPGKDLVLTIDLGTQQIVESVLDELTALRAPVGADVVVMSARDGAILALAGRPDYDPNLISKARSERAPINAAHLTNRAVSRPTEPGSTFKLLTIAAALDAGVITEHSVFHCRGTEEDVGGHPLRCWGEWAQRGHGALTPAGILANSCNLGAAQVARKLGARRFVEFLERCGISERPRAGFPAETAGRLLPPEQMRVRDLACLGFGHGVLVSDLQLAAAVTAIVNGGVLYQPRIAQGYVVPLSGESYDVRPRMVRRVCKAETSETMRRLMQRVVDQGTGRPAAIPGVAVGGKTATAQIYDPTTGKYQEGPGAHILSFVLAAPMDGEPDFVVLVSVERPRIGSHGSEVAAPVARRIAEHLLAQPELFRRRQHAPEESGAAPEQEAV